MRLLCAIILLLASATAALAAPNFVVIMTDDQDDTGSMAYMPKTLSLIAKQGITFKNSFVDLPLCGPSRASFFTGQAAHTHGIRANSPLDAGGWEAFKSKEQNSIPVWLQGAGYKTALIGKYMNRYGQQSVYGAWLAWFGSLIGVEFKGVTIGNPRDWVPPGWSLWYAFTGTRARYYDYTINDNGEMIDFGDAPADYSTDVLKARAARFIRDQSASKDPFFLYVAPKSVHVEGARAIPAPKYKDVLSDVQLPKGPAFNEKHIERKALKAPRVDSAAEQEMEKSYRAALRSLQSVDDLVADLVAALKDAGKLDNTVFIYTSDNGFLFGDHRLVGKTAAYEGSIRVPLLMRGPGIPADQTRDQLVNNLDVTATIVALAGAKPGLAFDGKSLVPLFDNANAPWRSALLIESPVTRFDKVTNRYAGVRTATKKYVRYEGGFEELFDLADDPYELKNEARDPDYAGDLSTLRVLQEKLRTCAGEDCWIP
jgi:N-acetylglucosamine-6-sulfatase